MGASDSRRSRTRTSPTSATPGCFRTPQRLEAFRWRSTAVGGVETIAGELVSGTTSTAGRRAGLRPGFLPEEDRRGAPVHVAVVSHAFWQNRLGATPSASAASITLNGSAYTVVGRGAAALHRRELGRAPDVWAPMALQQELRPPAAGLRRSLGSADLLGARGPRWLACVAHVKPGTPGPSRMAGSTCVARRLRTAYPDTNRGARIQRRSARRRPGRAGVDAAAALAARGGGRARAPHRLRERDEPAAGAKRSRQREVAVRGASAPAARGSCANG